ncbi:hypothetical protein FBY28_3913 [Arthrobacter sp. SLBN-53]|nr:hypothetical protein FBY28_3913 [Arthrobacter sp. SLBN-53]
MLVNHTAQYGQVERGAPADRLAKTARWRIADVAPTRRRSGGDNTVRETIHYRTHDASCVQRRPLHQHRHGAGSDTGQSTAGHRRRCVRVVGVDCRSGPCRRCKAGCGHSCRGSGGQGRCPHREARNRQRGDVKDSRGWIGKACGPGWRGGAGIAARSSRYQGRLGGLPAWAVPKEPSAREMVEQPNWVSDRARRCAQSPARSAFAWMASRQYAARPGKPNVSSYVAT